MSSSDSDGLRELEVTVKESLGMIKSSALDEVLAEPQSTWHYDPVEAKRDEVELRDLLGAIETVEQGKQEPRPTDDPPAASATD